MLHCQSGCVYSRNATAPLLMRPIGVRWDMSLLVLFIIIRKLMSWRCLVDDTSNQTEFTDIVQLWHQEHRLCFQKHTVVITDWEHHKPLCLEINTTKQHHRRGQNHNNILCQRQELQHNTCSLVLCWYSSNAQVVQNGQQCTSRSPSLLSSVKPQQTRLESTRCFTPRRHT